MGWSEHILTMYIHCYQWCSQLYLKMRIVNIRRKFYEDRICFTIKTTIKTVQNLLLCRVYSINVTISSKMLIFTFDKHNMYVLQTKLIIV